MQSIFLVFVDAGISGILFPWAAVSVDASWGLV